MDLLELRMRTGAEGLLGGEDLAELLRQWILQTRLGRHLVEVTTRPGQGEVLARLTSEQRTVEVLLHHDPGPPDHKLMVEAWTWVTPQPAAAFWPEAAGALVATLGLGATMLWVTDRVAPFVVGVLVSLALGRLVTTALRQRSVHRRTLRATRAAGGQSAAQTLLRELDEVMRADPRVAEILER